MKDNCSYCLNQLLIKVPKRILEPPWIINFTEPNWHLKNISNQILVTLHLNMDQKFALFLIKLIVDKNLHFYIIYNIILLTDIIYKKVNSVIFL